MRAPSAEAEKTLKMLAVRLEIVPIAATHVTDALRADVAPDLATPQAAPPPRMEATMMALSRYRAPFSSKTYRQKPNLTITIRLIVLS